MDWRRGLLFGACVFLCGFSSCTRFMAAQQEANRRADEMEQQCKAMENRDISFEEEQSFGGAVSVNWVSQGGGLTARSDARALHLQLNKIGKNLAAQSSRPTLPWTFGVLQSPGVNAVSGPGGYVFVTEGLLARLDNEAQLAGVLAHEIAHITGKHALNEYQKYLVSECEEAASAERNSPLKGEVTNEATQVVRSAKSSVGQLTQGLSRALPFPALREGFAQFSNHVKAVDFNSLGKEFIRAITEGVIAHLADKGFAEQDEFDADQQAVELMAAAGYAPGEYVTFLSKLPDGGLSTAHPKKKTRQDRLLAHLKKLNEPEEDGGFTTSVDLSQTKTVPLRDALQTRPTGSATLTH